MTIWTVTITGVSPNPEVYGGLAAALNYVAGDMFGEEADAWLGRSTNDQSRSLRAATVFLDRQPWDGDATGLVGVAVTTLQFPRTGLTRNGEDVDSTIVPPEVEQATFELAVLVAANFAVLTALDQGTNVSSVSAGGGVSVSFFHPTSAAQGTATRLPIAVQRLIGRFLASADSSVEGGFGQAGCSTTQMARTKQFNLVGPE